MYEYKAKVEQVVSGDTVVARVDLGFGQHVSERFRLFGIKCHDPATVEGMNAVQFIRDWLQPTAGHVTIRTTKSRNGWLATVFGDPMKAPLNAELSNAGLANVVAQ